MFARGLYSSRIGFVVIAALCGSCLASDVAGDDDKGQEPSAVGSAPAGEGEGAFEWSQGKLIPARPRDQSGVVIGDWLSAAMVASQGPRASTFVTTPGSMDFTASSTSLWPGEPATLTVNAFSDVRPPKTIDIWDAERGGVIASCSSGTTCSTTVTRANADHATFIAVIGERSVTNVLGFSISTVIPEASATLDVTWHRSGLWLFETPTVPVSGGVATLLAFTIRPIAAPFVMDVYDVTAGTRVKRCTAGQMCLMNVINPTNVNNPTPTTHRYRACITLPSASFPPSNALECTADHPVSWATASAPRVLLTVSPATTGGFAATATTAIDVGPTPYWIQIYEVNSGARLMACKTGTSCSAPLAPEANIRNLVAFVGPSSETLPGPAESGLDQSNSNTVPMAPPTGGQGAAVVSGPVIGPPGIPNGVAF